MELARIGWSCFPEEFQKVFEVVVKGRTGSRSFWKQGRLQGQCGQSRRHNSLCPVLLLCLQLLGAPVGTKLPSASGIFILCPDKSLRGVCACGVGKCCVQHPHFALSPDGLLFVLDQERKWTKSSRVCEQMSLSLKKQG